MKKLTILFLILFFFSECKYEKGPLITFTTKENRVIGNWKVDEYFINGEDKLSNLDTLELKHYSFFISDFGGSIGSNYHYIQLRSEHSNIVVPDFTRWGFSENKKFLELSQSWYGVDSTWAFQGIPLFVNETEELWTIVKLSNKKMWLRIKVDNNEYEIHLYNTKN